MHQDGEIVTNTRHDDELDPQYEKILNSMGHELISIDALIERSGLEVGEVSSILLILELNNQVTHHGNGIYIRRNFIKL